MAENALASAADGAATQPAGVPGYPGPFPVGRYALKLRDRMRDLARVCVVGEVTGARIGKGPNVYFELRDADGALPCAMWRTDFERTGLSENDLKDGAQVVAAGGCDYYVGSASASPSFRFRVQELRPAGEGDLLARLERLRRQLASEGLFELQKRHAIPRLPRRIGVVTAEGSAARRDFLAALERRSWRGTIVWGYAPVQDRRAATAIAGQIRELAALGDVEAIVVTRGGGSIADLWAFCDEALCRTVALLPVPVISAVGHEIDRTLIDEVSAICCSTPTHAAEAAVAIDCAVARAQLETAARGVDQRARKAVDRRAPLALAAKRIDTVGRTAVDRRAPLLASVRRIDVAGSTAVRRHAPLLANARRIHAAGRTAVLRRARELAVHSRAPREHLARHRVQLHQKAREIRAASTRGIALRIDFQRRVAAAVFDRKLAAARREAGREREALPRRAAELDRAAERLAERREHALRAARVTLDAHDPQRTLERGYALVTAADGEPLATAGAVRSAGRFQIRLADAAVAARVDESPSDGAAPAAVQEPERSPGDHD
jgi:exodeoxyribonuclease VII large subunit